MGLTMMDIMESKCPFCESKVYSFNFISIIARIRGMLVCRYKIQSKSDFGVSIFCYEPITTECTFDSEGA